MQSKVNNYLAKYRVSEYSGIQINSFSPSNFYRGQNNIIKRINNNQTDEHLPKMRTIKTAVDDEVDRLTSAINVAQQEKSNYQIQATTLNSEINNIRKDMERNA